MKYAPRLLLSTFTLLILAHAALAAPLTLNVITYNVLVDIEEKPGVPTWEARRDLAVATMKAQSPDLFALEECTPAQYKFMQDQFPDFDSIGAVPLEGKEYELFKQIVSVVTKTDFKEYTDALLFFRREVFERIDDGHIWLSPTPERMSNGYGNFLPRLAVWARLKHKPTGKIFLVTATHFDNTSPAQKHMAAQLKDTWPTLLAGSDEGIFLGDFNSNPGSEAYETILASGWKNALTTVRETAPAQVTTVDDTTGDDDRIDHIFYRGPLLQPVAWRRLEAATRLSDHFPVFAGFVLNEK